jgi:hypothetical protein
MCKRSVHGHVQPLSDLGFDKAKLDPGEVLPVYKEKATGGGQQGVFRHLFILYSYSNPIQSAHVDDSAGPVHHMCTSSTCNSSISSICNAVYIPAEDAVSTAPAFSAPPGLPSVPGHSCHHHHDDIEPDGHHHLHLRAGDGPDVLHPAVRAGAVPRLMNTMYYVDGEDVGSMGRARVSREWVVVSDEGPLPGSPVKRMAALGHFPLLFSQLVHHIVIVVNEHVFFALSPHCLNWLCDI